MIKDYQNKSGRLNKRKDTVDFNLADNDDFFGFTTEEIEMPYWKQILIAIVMVAILYGMIYILLVLTPNI